MLLIIVLKFHNRKMEVKRMAEILPNPARMKAPMTIKIVWTKSVQMTAESPPATVKMQAMA